MTLTEIARGIDAHLTRFAADPAIAADVHDYGNGKPIHRTKFYQSGARRGGAKVMVRYVSFQGETALDREHAAAYLEWLNAGNIGKHHQSLSSSPSKQEG